MPPMDNMDSAQMGQMSPGADQGDQSAQPSDSLDGFLVIIHKAKDGTLSVGVETDKEEAAEAGQGGEMAESAGEQADDGFREVGSPKEALTLALEILRNDGKMPDDGGQADAEFNAGYKAR